MLDLNEKIKEIKSLIENISKTENQCVGIEGMWPKIILDYENEIRDLYKKMMAYRSTFALFFDIKNKIISNDDIGSFEKITFLKDMSNLTKHSIEERDNINKSMEHLIGDKVVKRIKEFFNEKSIKTKKKNIELLDDLNKLQNVVNQIPLKPFVRNAFNNLVTELNVYINKQENNIQNKALVADRKNSDMIMSDIFKKIDEIEKEEHAKEAVEKSEILKILIEKAHVSSLEKAKAVHRILKVKVKFAKQISESKELDKILNEIILFKKDCVDIKKKSKLSNTDMEDVRSMLSFADLEIASLQFN